MPVGQVKSAAQAAANWAQRMGDVSTTTKWLQGIQGLTVSPTQQAATQEALQRYLNGTQQAVQSGRMAARLQAVSLGSFQQACNAAQGNLSAGARKGAPKQAQAAQKLQPVWQAMRAKANELPKGGLSNAVARVQAALQVQFEMTSQGQAR